MTLLAVAWLTGLFFWAQLDQKVDVENRSLKSVGTAEEEAHARRVRGFGEDATVVLLFETLPAGTGTVSASEVARVAAVRQKIAELPGVASTREVRVHREGALALAVTLYSSRGTWPETITKVRAAAMEHGPPSMRLAMSGQPVGEVTIASEVQREQRRVVPLIAGGLVLALFLFYRHAGLVAAILLPAGIGIVWTGGICAILGRELDPVSVMLNPVLLTVGVASGVHYIEGYLDELTAGRPTWIAAHRSMANLLKPAMLAALTTVVGFLSLAINRIPAIIDFGIFAAFGVGLTFVIAALTTPALLGLLAPRVNPRFLERRGSFAGELGQRAADALARHGGTVRVAAWAVALMGAIAWTRIGVDNDPIRLLPEDHPFRVETSQISAALGGSETFDVLVPSGGPLASPPQLALLAAQTCALPVVAGPAGPAMRAENGDWLLRFVLSPSGSRDREATFAEIERRARSLGGDDLSVTGTSVRVARDSGTLVRGQLSGAGASMLVLFLIFWIAFRSLRYAWLAMVPNVFPCIVVYGGMAMLGRPLSVSTAMISSVLLGLIVDDTIHLLHRLREAREAGQSPLEAVESVFRNSGRAIVITSLVLAGGFALSMTGRLTSTVEFGVLASITVITALLSDLLLIPVLMVPTRDEIVPDPVDEAEAVHA
ncbi:MAG: MMPL family transporter [Planctomycetes bacterium]|nr:MMPL family transporter [Planctomycetota bacterium]